MISTCRPGQCQQKKNKTAWLVPVSGAQSSGRRSRRRPALQQIPFPETTITPAIRRRPVFPYRDQQRPTMTTLRLLESRLSRSRRSGRSGRTYPQRAGIRLPRRLCDAPLVAGGDLRLGERRRSLGSRAYRRGTTGCNGSSSAPSPTRASRPADLRRKGPVAHSARGVAGVLSLREPEEHG